LGSNNFSLLFQDYSDKPDPKFPRNDVNVKKFVDNYLGMDGITALKLIAKNSGMVSASETLQKIWDAYANFDIKKRQDLATKLEEEPEDSNNVMSESTCTTSTTDSIEDEPVKDPFENTTPGFGFRRIRSNALVASGV
jgi:hypothetical protein